MGHSRDIFHNASLRLSALYLIIIMAISLLFSIVLYNVLSGELEQSLKRPISQQERRLLVGRETDIIELIIERELEFDDAQSRLRYNLIIINLAIFVLGGGLSYLLARRSLLPIEEAHEAQSRFTADASHELRTPITAMRMETELTLTEPKLTLKHAKQQLESNIEELDKLTTLSENLLQLARLDGNELDTEAVSVDHILEQAIDRVRKKAEQKKQLIVLKGANNLELNVNQMTVVEAIVTILDNAVKYAPEKTEIIVTKKRQKNMISIAVKDKGPGIGATDLPHIFDRFYRADSSRTQSSEHGYGIGLSIAKSAIEAHDGSIVAESTLGKGSTFTITLPKA